jgi:type IX secretion system PorP/SprF family membrane protein
MLFFRRTLTLFLFILISGTSAFAQLPTFSGFWLTPQLTAPTAMAGNHAYQVSAHYRRQAFEEGVGYRTYLLSGQFPLYSRANTQFGTLGVNVMQEESGSSFLFSNSGVMLNYLYDANIAYRHHLVGGVQGGYYWRKIDWSKVTTNNQYVDGSFDPALGSGEQFSNDPSKAFLVNVGLAYYLSDEEGDPIFHIGGALTNANNGSFNYLLNSESQAIPKALVGYAHLRLISNPYYEVVSDLYLRNEKNLTDLVGGFQVRKGTKPRVDVADNHLGVGLYYSQDHTGILALQLIQPNWLIGISYDMVFGNQSLRNMQSAVEVTLGWRAIRKGNDRNQNPRRYRKKLPWQKKNRLPWKSSRRRSRGF